LGDLCARLRSWADGQRVNISLPSMRADAFTGELAGDALGVRGSTLTFAPEAGTPRLRDVINKNLTEEEILRAADIAFAAGRSSIKLYFMIGLPTETDEDVLGIAALTGRILERSRGGGRKGRASLTVSAATFVPKPHTPFQYEPQCPPNEVERRQRLLRNAMPRGVKLSYHDARISRLEAVFARGDRRLGAVLTEARRQGLCFDGWDELFNYDGWMRAFEAAGIEPAAYAAAFPESWTSWRRANTKSMTSAIAALFFRIWIFLFCIICIY